jgi:hypothetical protein
MNCAAEPNDSFGEDAFEVSFGGLENTFERYGGMQM